MSHPGFGMTRPGHPTLPFVEVMPFFLSTLETRSNLSKRSFFFWVKVKTLFNYLEPRLELSNLIKYSTTASQLQVESMQPPIIRNQLDRFYG